MVVDGTRIPAPGISKSRLARPTPPVARTTTTIRASPRPSTTAAPPTARRHDAHHHHRPPPTSGLPTPRRISRPTDPPRRLSRPGAPADRPDPPSTRRRAPEPVTPRRLSAGKPIPPGTRPASRITPSGSRLAPSTSASKRPATSRPARASAEPASARVRLDERPSLPDRGAAAVVRPARRALQESPYARRSSAGGGGVSSRGGTHVVVRKLNMHPGDDDDVESGVQTTQSSRTAQQESSVVRRSSLPRNPDRSLAAPSRRASGPGAVVPGSARRGVSALESFRAARRASLEGVGAEPAAVTAAAPVVSAGGVGGPMGPPSVIPVHPPPEMDLSSVALEERTVGVDISSLPDRPDSVGIGATPVPVSGTPGRRQGARFSDANVYLKDVERLRWSLGRRRSIDVNDPVMPDTPKLRRSSLGMGCVDSDVDRMGSGELQRSSEEEDIARTSSSIATPVRQRSPLKSIFSNGENFVHDAAVVTGRKKDAHAEEDSTPHLAPSLSAMGATPNRSRSSRMLPKLDEYDIDLDMEDVEDLSAGW